MSDSGPVDGAPRPPPRRARRPTIGQVAALAEVSPTTVSFVLNGREDGRISAATQQRVRDAVHRLGYRPNHTARGLRTARTQTIGLLTDDVAVEPFAGAIITGAHDAAWEQGSLLFVVNTSRNQRELRTVVENLLDRQVDAIIFAATGTRLAVLPDAVRHVPTVLVNCFVAGDALPCVLPDEEAGGRAAAEVLLAAGHRDIAYIGGLPGAWATRQRLRGYRASLRSAGISYDAALVSTGNFDAASGYSRTRELLAAHRPTGLLCGNDRIALGAYFALLEAGLRVPADVSVVGYDDQVALPAELHPPLSSVRLPYAEMGRWAVEQLLSGASAALPPRTYLPCPPAPRASVAPPRAG